MSFSPHINCTEIYPETEFLLVLEGVAGSTCECPLAPRGGSVGLFLPNTLACSVMFPSQILNKPRPRESSHLDSCSQFCSYLHQSPPPKLLPPLKWFRLYRYLYCTCKQRDSLALASLSLLLHMWTAFMPGWTDPAATSRGRVLWAARM